MLRLYKLQAGSTGIGISSVSLSLIRSIDRQQKKMKLSTSTVLVLALVILMSTSATTDWVVVAASRIPPVPKRANQAAEVDATCDPAQMSPCLGPIQSGLKPSSTCCNKLKEQVPCLCGYIKNPAFKQFVTGPNAQKLSANCGVPFPKCS